MKPTDFPIGRLAELEGVFIGQADAQRERARVASGAGGADPNEHQAFLSAAGTPEGFYESSLTYYEAARQVSRTIDDVVRDIDVLAAHEADPHVWPIAHLANLDTELNRDRDEGLRQRHPLWGIPVEHHGCDGFIGVSASTRQGEVLLYKFIGAGETGDGDFINVDIENWRALNQLVERIEAGKPVPYDKAGSVHSSGMA